MFLSPLSLIFECGAAIDMSACYDGIHADGGYGVKVVSSSMPGDGAGGSVSFILIYFALISLILAIFYLLHDFDYY